MQPLEQKHNYLSTFLTRLKDPQSEDLIKIALDELDQETQKRVENFLYGDFYIESLREDFLFVGGFALSLLRGGSFGDIDVVSKTTIKSGISIFKEIFDNVVITAWALTAETTFKFQLMKFYAGDPNIFFQSYDLNICKVAYDHKTESFLVHPDVLRWDKIRSSEWLIKKDYSKSLVPVNNFLIETWTQRFIKYNKRYPLEIDRDSMTAFGDFLILDELQNLEMNPTANFYDSSGRLNR